jgi:ribonuclease HII
MGAILGVDEAGYGPNLGPLVVAATLWPVERGDAEQIDLYESLTAAVSAAPTRDGRIAIADSKRLYKPGSGSAALARGVLGALGVSVDTTPAGWSDLLPALGVPNASFPWQGAIDPRIDPPPTLAADIAALAGALREAGLGAPVVRARIVWPAEFNALLDRHGTKGAALSHVSLGLARDTLASVPFELPVRATLDKHGGRNRYAALVQQHLAARDERGWVETQSESRAESRYRVGRTCVAFRAKGEALLEVALASMTAKLLRELAMDAFNAYWRSEITGLIPTAGYPQDAKRFWSDTTARRAELRLDDRDWWRRA